VKDTKKVKKESFVHETVKKTNLKLEKFKFLDYVIQSKCIKKDSEKTMKVRN